MDEDRVLVMSGQVKVGTAPRLGGVDGDRTARGGCGAVPLTTAGLMNGGLFSLAANAFVGRVGGPEDSGKGLGGVEEQSAGVVEELTGRGVEFAGRRYVGRGSGLWR